MQRIGRKGFGHLRRPGCGSSYGASPTSFESPTRAKLLARWSTNKKQKPAEAGFVCIWRRPRDSVTFTDPDAAAPTEHRRHLSNPPREPNSWLAGLLIKQSPPKRAFLHLAETEGFEPSIHFLSVCSLSRGVPSTTRPGLRASHFTRGACLRWAGVGGLH
jgi:hypothetical protein